ncbi:hypothetical protein [Phytoactinopolyspora endophytica]|uniref:hypothetical protein n=1 Tax=Phytoactinopolyspora endophytica TaxID=1642495 RepID=UPI00197B989F|nr:hypothetical protein [Phytoactinopolyspora endophytica]
MTEPLDTAHGALGANFNEQLGALNHDELRLAQAQWVRGFFHMPETDHGDPGEHPGIRAILETADRGFNTIFSLKFPYNKASFPEPGSAEMAAELARLDKVLPTVMGKADIVTIGNEPFLESLPEERDERLNEFYEAIAQYVIDYRRTYRTDRTSRLYMGAYNRLDLEDSRTPAAERWMTFVRETPEIEGVDIHPHLADGSNAQAFVDYILPRMRDDQTFLVTEFSIVWHWKQHLNDTISADFASTYGFDPDTRVWEVAKAAIENPFSERQWHDFLASSEWFMAQSSYLHDQMNMYRGTGRLAVATYGFRQQEDMTTNMGPDKDPWLFNSVFARYTVQLRDAHMSAPGFWLDSFRSLQNI